MRTIKPFSYTTPTPHGYVCEKCGVSGVRLYREYQTFADSTQLTCTQCTETEKDKFSLETPHAIGWKVAAVPTEDGSTFWGFTSVPQAGVEWWNALPTTPPTP